MLSEDLEKTGNYLFKHRSYIPVVLFVIATLAVLFDHLHIVFHGNIYWSIICLLISLFGLFIRVITVSFTPKNTSGRNTSKGQIADTINTTEMYSLVRHPLYLGNFFMWAGLILFVAIPWVIILSIAFFWFYYERIMLAEEKFIQEKFTQHFDEWAARTPAFFPRSLSWIKSENSFSLKKVLRREYSGVLALSVSFVFFDVLKNLSYDGHFEISNFWLITGITGFLIWFVLRSLRKWTNLLDSKKKS